MFSLRRKLLELMTGGVTPEKIAQSVAVGAVLGVFPAFGWTTLLCAAAAWAMRLNLPAIQMVNWVVYPLQFALIVPFLRAGAWAFGVPAEELTAEGIVELIRVDVWGAVRSLWWATLRGVAVWAVVGPAAGLAIYYALRPGLRRLAERIP